MNNRGVEIQGLKICVCGFRRKELEGREGAVGTGEEGRESNGI